MNTPAATAVDLPEPEDEGAYSFRAIGSFLRRQPERGTRLADMIRAVFLQPQTSRRLIIRDEVAEGPRWVAAVQKALPLRQAALLSISTYQSHETHCADINATTGETDLEFGHNQREHLYYMFDFTGDRYSSVPTSTEDYAAIVRPGVDGAGPDRIEDLAFAAQLFPDLALGPDWDFVAGLYCWVTDLDRHPSGERAAAMLNTALRFVSGTGFDRLVDGLLPILTDRATLPIDRRSGGAVPCQCGRPNRATAPPDCRQQRLDSSLRSGATQ